MKIFGIRVLRVLASIVALALLSTIVNAAYSWMIVHRGPTTHQECAPGDMKIPEDQKPRISSRHVEVRVVDGQIHANILLEIPRTLPLVKLLQDASLRKELDDDEEFEEIQYRCMPRVTVDNASLRMQSISFESRSSSTDVTANLKFEPHHFWHGENSPEGWARVEVRADQTFEAQRSTVVLHASRVNPEGSPWPDRLDADAARWTNRLNAAYSVVSANLWIDASKASEEAHPQALSARSFLKKLPFDIRAGLNTLAAATPFLLLFFVLAIPQFPGRETFAPVVAVAAAMIALTGARALTYLAEPLTSSVGSLIVDLGKWVNLTSLDRDQGYAFGIDGVFLVMVMVAIPGLVTRLRVSLPSNPSDSVFAMPIARRWILFCALASLASMALFWHGVNTADSPDHWSNRALIARFLVGDGHGIDSVLQTLSSNMLTSVAFAGGLWICAYWMLREFAASQTPVFLALVATMFLLALQFACDFFWRDLTATTFLVFAIVTPAAIAITRLMVRATRILLDIARPPAPIWVLAWIVLMLVVVAWLAQPRSSNEMIGSRVNGVILPLSGIIATLALGLIILGLKRWNPPGDQVDLTSSVRLLAGAILCAFVLWPSRDWLELAVVLMLAWWMLRHLAFTAPSSAPVGFLALSTQSFRASIREIVLQSTAQNALRARHQQQASKLADGTIELEAYAEKVTRLDEDIAKRAAENSDLVDTGMSALTSGPAMLPWKRGLLGARLGAIAGAPWTLLFIVSSMSQSLNETNSEILSFVLATVFASIQWTIVGFVFLYFYPWIRGRTGFHKGWALFTSIAVPVIAGALVASALEPIEWPRTLFWLMQFLAVCMVVGVLGGDYEVLRTAGLGWRHLIDVHRLGKLTAWASSLLVALGAAISAALSTEAVRWLAAGAQLFTQNAK
jgi:hypothetical protein